MALLKSKALGEAGEVRRGGLHFPIFQCFPKSFLWPLWFAAGGGESPSLHPLLQTRRSARPIQNPMYLKGAVPDPRFQLRIHDDRAAAAIPAVPRQPVFDGLLDRFPRFPFAAAALAVKDHQAEIPFEVGSQKVMRLRQDGAVVKVVLDDIGLNRTDSEVGVPADEAFDGKFRVLVGGKYDQVLWRAEAHPSTPAAKRSARLTPDFHSCSSGCWSPGMIATPSWDFWKHSS